MNPTTEWLQQAEGRIRHTLEQLRPQLLETQGKIEHRLKDDKSAVTEMDILVEERLREVLHEFDSGIAFSGEETCVDYSQKTFWLTDPIDGTEPFIRGLPFATNMVALIDQGHPVLGIINNIALGEYYMAIKGRGATCNGHPISVSGQTIDRAFVSLARSQLTAKETFGLGDRMRSKWGSRYSMFNVGASGYAMCVVASGGIEARISYQGVSKPWDYAAGALLVQEAGGRVANIGMDAYDYRDINFVAANPVVFDELMQFMSTVADEASGA